MTGLLNFTSPKWFKSLFVLLVILDLPSSIRSAGNGDMLVYKLSELNGNTSLTLYDPHKGVNTPILTNTEFGQFSFSVDGLLAFSSKHENDEDIFLLDTLSADSSPINITVNPTMNDYPLAWSPDGHFLAFESYNDKNRLIHVWNGETIVDITPNDLEGTVTGYTASWSLDGRLAFTVWAGTASSEIYLWADKSTSNLSQNPSGEDFQPVWSTDGRVAFLSNHNDSYDIFVWDGSSIKDGLPNTDTFINIAPELTAYYSFPTWTNKNFLAFEATPPEEHYAQIYLWDGQTVTNISQNPNLHNGGARWSSDGRWAFVTFFSPQQLIYVQDTDNQPLLTTQGQYTPAWSSNGYLIFCKPRWVLSMWDGHKVTEIIQGYEIKAQWQGGSGVTCSSG